MCTDIGIIDQGRMVLEGNITAILSRVNASNPLVISVYSNMEQAMAVLAPPSLCPDYFHAGKGYLRPLCRRWRR